MKQQVRSESRSASFKGSSTKVMASVAANTCGGSSLSKGEYWFLTQNPGQHAIENLSVISC